MSGARIHWLFEADVFPDYSNEFVAAVRECGSKVTVLPAVKPGYSFEDAGQPDQRLASRDECVIFHGCIGLAERIRSETDWCPGFYGDFERLTCSFYFPALGEFLLNSRYAMLPFREVRRLKDHLFNSLGRDGQFFMRPNSPKKLFAGMLIRSDHFEKDYELAAFYDVPDQEIVVVAPAQRLLSEWRFVVVDGRVVSGSCYREGNQPCHTAGASPDAIRFAERVASNGWCPDRAWTIDVAQTTAGEYGLIEIGSFSYANLYACDLRAVIDSVQKVAVEDWTQRIPLITK